MKDYVPTIEDVVLNADGEVLGLVAHVCCDECRPFPNCHADWPEEAGQDAVGLVWFNFFRMDGRGSLKDDFGDPADSAFLWHYSRHPEEVMSRRGKLYNTQFKVEPIDATKEYQFADIKGSWFGGRLVDYQSLKSRIREWADEKNMEEGRL